MAKRIASNINTTLTATADTTNLVDSTYPIAIQGTQTTQQIVLYEVYMGGQSTSSAPTYTLLSFDSQIATGSLTKDATLNDTLLNGGGTALVSGSVPTVFNKAATNKPQRDVAKHLMPLSFNAFGGVVRWLAAPGEEITMVGVTASYGEVSLSAFTGGAGIISSHIVFETL
jgi:hypothetical protein